MWRNLFATANFVSLLAFGPVFADHHSATGASGPNGGLLVAIGDKGHYAEVVLERAEQVTVYVLNREHQPVATKASDLTLTFTEPDGEKEDYQVGSAKGEGVFTRKSSHLVHHVVRDKMSITVAIGSDQLSSKVVTYPYGPNGGRLVPLGELFAELVLDKDLVQIHMLDSRKRATKVDAKEITLTFTESDGEKEDYGVLISDDAKKSTWFERDDDHVVKHIKRDKMSISVTAGQKKLQSESFFFSKH